MQIHLPNVSKEELENLAGSTDVKDIVNHLRHEYTSYNHKYTLSRFKEVNAAISETYPWLYEECERQIKSKSSRRNLMKNAHKSRNPYF